MRITYQSQVPDFRAFAIRRKKKALLAFRKHILPIHLLNSNTEGILFKLKKNPQPNPQLDKDQTQSKSLMLQKVRSTWKESINGNCFGTLSTEDDI